MRLIDSMPKRTPVSDFEKRLSPSDIPNPFARWASENEPRLKEFFVRGPLFGILFRDEQEIETRFIFGPPGSGKTAYHRMLARRLRPQNRNSAILAADYFELNSPRLAESERASDTFHWHMLQRAALLALVRDFLIDPQPFFALFPPSRAQLAKFFQELFPAQQPLLLANWLRRPEQEYPELGNAIEAQDAQYAARFQKQWELLETLRAPCEEELASDEIERVRALVMLVERCGLKRLCVFVDGVDKTVEQGKPQNALDLILPLIHSLQLLDEMHLAVEFFLPQELASSVQHGRNKRHDLNWTDEQLTELLRQRLEIVSDNKVSSLGQLAEEQPPEAKKQNPPRGNASKPKKKESAKTADSTPKDKTPEPLSQRLDRELVRNAHGSPRQLIRLATALFDAYDIRAPREGLFIQADLDAALAAERGTLKRDLLVPPLVIDERLGRFFVGDREVTADLSAKEKECLILLKQAGGKTLSREEIWKKLNPEQMTEPSRTQTDPFFSRLRGILERDSKHPVYLITDWGSGFHLENVAD